MSMYVVSCFQLFIPDPTLPHVGTLMLKEGGREEGRKDGRKHDGSQEHLRRGELQVICGIKV